MASTLDQLDQEELAFSMVGVSIWNTVGRLTQARLISLQSLQRAVSSEPPELDLKTFHLYEQEQRRYALTASVGALDSFLADTLTFLFMRKPEAIPLSFRQRVGEIEEAYLNRVLRAMGPPKKLVFLAKYLGLELGPTLDELTSLFVLRNKIVHQSGFYVFSRMGPENRLWATAQALPVPSAIVVQKAQVLVTEVSDAIFVAMFRSLFGHDPKLRPLTPEISAAHRTLREQWASELRVAPKTEDHSDPQWRGWRWGAGWYLSDKTRSFLISYTGIENIPALITFMRNDIHGTEALVSVDDGEPVPVRSPEAFRQLMAGKKAVVIFHEIPFDEERRAVFSLDGFREAWEELGRRFSTVSEMHPDRER